MPRAKSNSSEGTKEKSFMKLESFEIRNAREVKTKDGKNTLCFATVVLNGVSVYGCRAVTYTDREGKEKDFLAWPEQKGSDGNYYKVAYAPLSDGDQQKICDAIYAAIDNKN